MPGRNLPPEPPSSEITPPELYARRREFIRQAGLFVATSALWGGAATYLSLRGAADPPPPPPKPPAPPPIAKDGAVVRDPWAAIAKNAALSRPADEQTPFESVTTWNNFYELGLSKTDPAKNAATLKPRPWTVRIEGHVGKPQTVGIDDLLQWFPLEERIYRMRCVEAWSMVIPWVGFPLADLLKRVEPSSSAKFVEFTTLLDSAQLPGEKNDVLDWPYVEGLRIDEAMHPLTLLAVGLYGAPLLGQNGAPLRLVVPWKYGFKGCKSIVSIKLRPDQPKTTWANANSDEYGFYANVNPAVDHPRWTQKNERRIGQLARIPTLPFNGYGEAVADLYRGQDLRRDF